MKSTIFIFLLLVTMSCQNSERKQIEQLVKEWTDREILLPEGPVFTRFATDTVSYTIQPARYKVIVFVIRWAASVASSSYPNGRT